MYLRYHAGRGVRHVGGAIAEGALIVGIVGGLVFGVSMVGGGAPAGAGDAYAAKGGKNALNAGSSISLNDGSDLRLGGKVTLTSKAVGLGGGEYPMIYVACWLDATGNKVYGQLDTPDTVFVLGSGAGPWWDAGGSADCKAWLYSYGGKTRGGYDDIYVLAGPESFHAAG